VPNSDASVLRIAVDIVPLNDCDKLAERPWNGKEWKGILFR